MTNGRTPLLQHRRDRQSGAVFAVAVMALLLLAASLTAGLLYTHPKADLQRTKETNQAIGTINTALAAYASRNGALPCPDTANTGIASIACDGTAAVPGTVPWKTLNIAPREAMDGWGNALSYETAINDSESGLYVCDANPTTAPKNSGGKLATWSGLTPATAADLLTSHPPSGAVTESSDGKRFGCLCVEPTISGTLNTDGSVTATASLTTPVIGPPNCNVAWHTNINTPPTQQIVTWSGKPYSVTQIYKTTGTYQVTASNDLIASWSAAVQPQTPSETFTVISATPGAAPAGSGGTTMPAMSGMGFGNSGQITTYSNGNGTTPVSSSGTASLSYSDAIGTITIASNGGILCYDGNYGTLGVVQSGGGCYLDGTAGDALTITLPTSNFLVFSMLLYVDAPGSVTVTEYNGAGLPCAISAISCANPIPFLNEPAGYLDIPWQEVIQTNAGPSTIPFAYKSLVIAPAAGAQVSLGAFIASP